jgi:hypothetical protein
MEWGIIVNNLFGLGLTIFMGFFAWETTKMVSEQRKKDRSKK